MFANGCLQILIENRFLSGGELNVDFIIPLKYFRGAESVHAYPILFVFSGHLLQASEGSVTLT